MKMCTFPATDARREAWAEHLRDVLNELEIPSGVVADNLIASIAIYCRQFHPRGLQASELKLLIARAFCTVDDRAAAGRVLESMEPHRRHVLRWLEILSELHHFPELLPYFSMGIIRPADWAGAQLDRMWTLDFSRLVLTEAERHEMMLYRTIRTLVEKMFMFWDATDGEGILGLKSLASLHVDAHGRVEDSITSPGDLLEFVTDLFDQQKARRGWHGVPSLLNLDL